MREIKFRAWDKKYKHMRLFDSHKDGILYASSEFCVSSGYDSYDSPTFEEDTSDDYEIMQYTGLKDKNGKEIYEGDILKINYGIPSTTDTLQVVWYSDYYLELESERNISYCGWFFKNIRGNGCSGPAGVEFQDDLEVIGNIHENSELLK